MEVKSEKDLADFITNHLPISEGDALDFVSGVLNGAMMSEKTNYAISLGFRDRVIKELREENKKLCRIINNEICIEE